MPKNHFSGIAWKGLMMVLLPLSLQLLFVLLFRGLIFQVLSELKSEHKSRLLVNEALLFSRSVVSGTSSLVGYKTSGDKRYIEQYAAAKKSADDNLSLLKKEASSNQQIALSKIEKAYSQISQKWQIYLLTNKISSTSELLNAPYFLQTQLLSQQLEDSVELFIDTETPSNLHQNIEFLLNFGIATGILASLTVALLFSKNIAGRLNLLIENTQRFSQGKCLLPQLAGNDEIATYDKAFHKMAEHIDTAKLYKDQLISVVSHEVRAPLTSSGAILSVLLAGIHGPLKDSTTKQLQCAEDEITDTVEMVNDFIDIDRLKSGKYPCDFSQIELHALAIEVLSAWKTESASPSAQIELSGEEAIVNGDRQLLKRLIRKLIDTSRRSAKDSTTILNISNKNSHATLSIYSESTDPAEHNNSSPLAICQAITEIHRGSLTIEKSKEDQTSFVVQFFLNDGVQS